MASLRLAQSNIEFFTSSRQGDVLFTATSNIQRIMMGNTPQQYPVLTLESNVATVGGIMNAASVNTNLIQSTGIHLSLYDPSLSNYTEVIAPMYIGGGGSTSSNAIYGSNVASYASNVAVSALSTAVSASNVAIETSNIAFPTNKIAISASNTANFTSNVAFPASNIAMAASNYASNIAQFSGSNMVVYRNVVPSGNETLDLGTPTQRFRTLYVSANTIDLGGVLVGTSNNQFSVMTSTGSNAPLKVGEATLTGAMTLSNKLTVTDTTNLYGALNVSNAVNVTGSTSMSNLTVFGTLSVQNLMYAYSNVTVYSSTDLRSNLTVQNRATLSNVTVSAGATLSNGATLQNGHLTLMGFSNVVGFSNGPVSYVAGSNACVGINKLGPLHALDVAGGVCASNLVTLLNATCSNVLISGKATLSGPAVGATGGNGERLVLLPGDVSTVPYAIGMSNSTMWFSTPTGAQFQWFENTTARGGLSNGNFTVTGDISAFGTVSDSNLKTNVQDLAASGTGVVHALRPVTYQWKDDIFNADKAGSHDVGFLAQDIETVIPLAVGEYKLPDGSHVYKNIKYERILPYLVKAVQELAHDVAVLKAR